MRDPVQDKEGNTFEKEAILSWINTHGTSPLTRTVMSVNDLVPNRALKDTITRALGPIIGDDWSVLGDNDASPVGPEADEVSTSSEMSEDSMSDGGVPRGFIPEYIPFITTLANKEMGSSVGDVLITVNPAAMSSAQERVPVDLCCVIDISGSMNTVAEIKVKDEDGNEKVENTGLTVLDVVKHALKTIISNMHEGDRLGLVTFSYAARKDLELTVMNTTGRETAMNIVTAMETEGSTNLWDGLKKGMEVLTSGRTSGSMRMNSLFLLTDGQPNVEPPRGSVQMLKNYLDEHDISCTINTFGFGYSLDGDMLCKLAERGSGSYSFIPDAGMVGTVFVHALSNLLVTYANKAELLVEATSGRILDIPGVKFDRTSWGIKVDLCALQYGQTKDLILSIDGITDTGPYVRVTLNYNKWDSLTMKTITFEGVGFATTMEEKQKIDIHKNRQGAVETFFQAMEQFSNRNGSTSTINSFVEKLKSSISYTSPEVLDLILDLKEQGTIAFETSYYNKWGKYYIPSLSRAHLLQQCNNFKDPGVQHYGGELFKQIRDSVDAVFDGLPPAVPSGPRYDYTSRRYVASTPVSMSSYNSRCDPCISGNSTVLVRKGDGIISTIRMDEVEKGTVLSNGAKVVCVVKTVLEKKETKLVNLSRDNVTLFITPWHPVKTILSCWKYPWYEKEPVMTPCEAIYSLILDKDHYVDSGHHVSVTLGHGFTEPLVIHPFVGTEKVIEHINKFPGYESGLVETCGTIRDDKTGLVCGFKPMSPIQSDEEIVETEEIVSEEKTMWNKLKKVLF